MLSLKYNKEDEKNQYGIEVQKENYKKFLVRRKRHKLEKNMKSKRRRKSSLKGGEIQVGKNTMCRRTRRNLNKLKVLSLECGLENTSWK